MSTPETITQKLHAKADIETRQQIEAQLAPLKLGYLERIKFDAFFPDEESGVITGRTRGEVVYRALVAALFERRAPAARDKAVSEFMQKVSAIQDQLEELQGQI